jgi:hypothetical protein
MSLATIMPGPSGFDLRTFACSGCDHVHVAIAEADPMRSDAVRWLAGHDLKTPTWIGDPLKRENVMEDFLHRENMIIFRRQLTEAKSDAQRQLLLKLLAEEEARDLLPKETR